VRSFLLKEYGSWGVMLISWLTGIALGRSFNCRAVAVLLAMALAVNSKQALMLWMRGAGRRKYQNIFLLQVAAAAAIFLALFGSEIRIFLPYAVLPAAYILLNRFVGEHAAATEVTGFFLLALSALLAKFAVTSEIDPRLYLAAALFFAAGVFKVRVQFRKRVIDRAVMILYLLLAVEIYFFLKLPVIVLIPFIDNLLFSVTLYKVKLRTAGWIEVAKGLAFLILMTFAYH
jgi:hypothetical protein